MAVTSQLKQAKAAVLSLITETIGKDCLHYAAINTGIGLPRVDHEKAKASVQILRFHYSVFDNIRAVAICDNYLQLN
jgi:hypothetical protein